MRKQKPIDEVDRVTVEYLDRTLLNTVLSLFCKHEFYDLVDFQQLGYHTKSTYECKKCHRRFTKMR